jgi:hypothetical protein
MVVFDPLVYPMDMAWLNGKVPAEHYRHSRPGYSRALLQEEAAAEAAKVQAKGKDNDKNKDEIELAMKS